VEGLRKPATQRHVGNGGLAGDVIPGYPIDARDDTLVTAAPTTVQYADADQMHLLRDTIGLAAHSARYVGPVSIAVGGVVVVVDFVDARGRASFKFRVREPNAGVDDVCIDARTSGVVRVGIVEGEISLIEPVETPIRI